MFGSFSSSSLGGSPSSGIELGSLEYAQYFVDNCMEVLSEALSDELSAQKKALNGKASSIDAWKDMGGSFDVEFSGNKVHYLFNSEQPNDYEKFVDTEYGSPQTPATPLVRPFAASNADPLAKRVEDRLKKAFL